jgi:hypothetical protein
MASTARYVSGDSKPRVFLASASYPFEKGDLLYEHPADHTLRRASNLANEGSAALNRLGFAEYFVGVAGVKNGLMSGEISFKNNQNFQAEVLVHTGGVWEFDCDADNYYNGQAIGVYATATACENQKVDAATNLNDRIGVAVLSVGAIKAGVAGNTMTRLQIEIMPARLSGGIPTAGTYTNTSGQ